MAVARLLVISMSTISSQCGSSGNVINFRIEYEAWKCCGYVPAYWTSSELLTRDDCFCISLHDIVNIALNPSITHRVVVFIISRIKLLTNLIIISIFARPQRHKHENLNSELQVHCKGTKIGQAHIEVKVLLD